MPHIHTEPGQHDHTASAYIVRTDFDEPKIMLHMHKKLHIWLQFGGHIELNETPWQAIAHELKEETGYDMPQLKILQPHQRLRKATGSSVHPVPLSYLTHPFGDIDHYHTDVAFAFVANEPPAHSVGKNEVSDFIYVGRSELDNQNIHEGIREIALFLFDEALPDWEAVNTNEFIL